MKDNIILIGYMGTGKTVVGHKLAEKLCWKFVDTDKMIEEIAHKDIPRIFREDGEKIFRKYECKAVKMITHLKNYVIATGGGAVLNEENVQHMKMSGTVILLSATPDVIYDRLKDDTTRPLLQVQDPAARIESMLKTRFPFYIKAADISIDTSTLSVDEVIDTIFKELEEQK